MAQEEDKVQYTKLLDAFHKLYNDLKNEKMKNKVLSKDNERLHEENELHSKLSFLNSQRDDFEKVILSLKKDNENFLKENFCLKEKLCL